MKRLSQFLHTLAIRVGKRVNVISLVMFLNSRAVLIILIETVVISNVFSMLFLKGELISPLVFCGAEMRTSFSNIIKNIFSYGFIVAVGLGAGLGVKYGLDWYNQVPGFVKVDTQAHFKNTEKKVVIYTTQWCPYCKKTKEYLKAHNVDFTERDIEQGDQSVDALFSSIGYPGIPKIVVGDVIINGFNASLIAQELKANHLL